MDRVGVTHHNTIARARAAQTLDPKPLIVSEEIMNSRGDIVTSCVTDEICAALGRNVCDISRLTMLFDNHCSIFYYLRRE
jgi:hypothetical protein